jgi:hypothetical protein
MPNPFITTLSSVGTSAAANLDWRNGGYVSAQVTLGTTTMTADFTIQLTLDDPVTSSATRAWFGMSSAVGSSVTHFSSAAADAGVYVTFLSPVAGLRISSTAISSSSLTLRVLQAGT